MKEITIVLNAQMTFILCKPDDEAAEWEREKARKIDTALKRLKEHYNIDDVRLLHSKVFIRETDATDGMSAKAVLDEQAYF